MSLLEDHASAFLTRIAFGGSPTLTVYDGKVPDPTPDPEASPYVVVRFVFYTQGAAIAPDKVNLIGSDRPLRAEAYTYAVAGGEAASRVIASAVYARLEGFTPTISGRTCFPIRHEDSAPREGSEVTGSYVGTTAHVYQLTSVPV
ncbi:MAG TPA: hypothetical protein VFY84_17540 [Jiangellales bacterium]|nr:hypothetical protein [Jiangellales bacterium]